MREESKLIAKWQKGGNLVAIIDIEYEIKSHIYDMF
jgi:hypothetical protein